jgi:hypothetical protein
MQLPLRPPMAPEEIELLKARTRQANLITWLSSLSIGMLLVIITVPICLTCAGCIVALIMTGVIGTNMPTNLH